jgi:hypothetical protein
MNDQLKTEPEVEFDGDLFTANRSRFPTQELAKYAGRHVAWSLDGTQILASGDDDSDVDNKLTAAGIDPSRVVHGYVEPLDGTSLL